MSIEIYSLENLTISSLSLYTLCSSSQFSIFSISYSPMLVLLNWINVHHIPNSFPNRYAMDLI